MKGGGGYWEKSVSKFSCKLGIAPLPLLAATSEGAI